MEASSQRVATSATVEGTRPVHDQGRRKVVDSAKVEQCTSSKHIHFQ